MAGLAWALAGVALLSALGALGFALWHVAAVRLSGAPRPGVVTLILPLTGDQPGLAALFAALAAQSFAARRLIVAVESAEDPAAAQALALADALPFPIELVVAGEAEETAQKCANLAAALARVDAADEVVVTLDGDIRPQPFWLAALVGPLLDGRYDLVTGYRWLMPGAGGWGAQAIAWLDRGAAILPKWPRLGLIWAGSTGYTRAALEQLDLPVLYARQLSDDLSAGVRARALGLRVLTRRILLLPVPGAGRGAGFYRRQFQFGWRYHPFVTLTALGVALGTAAGWVALVGLLLGGSGLAALALILLVALRVALWILHGAIAARIASPDDPRARRRQLAMALLPWPVLLLPFVILAALPARRMEWRGVRYAIRGPERLRVTWRARWEAPPPCPITGRRDSVRIAAIPVSVLHGLWRVAHRAVPTPLRRGTRIGMWRASCGLMFFDPMVAGDAEFYRTLYRRNRFGELALRAAPVRVEFMEAARHVAPGATVLEIGAGTGGFARHLPPGVRYIGLDPHSGAYATAQGAEIRAVSLEAHAAAHPAVHDVACAFQVIEHVEDPLATARTMLGCLRPGGLLILVAPLWPSPLTAIPNLPINLPPHHLTCWNPEAMRALAAAIGAEVVEARAIAPSPHVSRLLWMARLSPVTPPPEGPWFQPRWSWHLSLILAWLLAFPASWLRRMPPGAAPIDVMLVARRPLSADAAPSAGPDRAAASAG
ncbi:MAG: methyltransferase domain-containing protein [Rubritepida sp.]|nr:methyltransferase domain-containing protein [Rubritepida sp.]